MAHYGLTRHSGSLKLVPNEKAYAVLY